MKTIIALLISFSCNAFAGDYLEGCNFDEIQGESFFFPQSTDGIFDQTYTFWSKKPIMLQANHLTKKDYVGRRGKILEQDVRSINLIAGKNIGGFKAAVLENCEIVYGQTPWATDRGIVITYEKDVEDAKKLIGTKIRLKNARVEQLRIKSIDGTKKYNVEHGENVLVTGVHTTRLPHMREAGTFYLVVKKDNGQEGVIGYSEKVFFMNTPKVAMNSELLKPININEIYEENGIK